MSEPEFSGLSRFTGLCNRGNQINQVNRGSDLLSTSNAKTVHYSGPFMYEDNDLKCIFTSAGRLTPVTIDGNVLYKFEYNLTDHLGNVRVTFGGHSNGGPEVIQVTDYDPFGLVMAQQNFVGTENSMPNKYLYNGKEIQDDILGGTALDWYDYGARMYDPVIGRWTTIDPKAEKPKNISYSVYNYVLNNPIKFIDPDGKDWILSTGNRIYWYGGNLNDKTNLIKTFQSSSGLRGTTAEGQVVNYQFAYYQNLKDKGPTPAGLYHINLSPDPERQPKPIKISDGKYGLGLTTEGGIEKLGIIRFEENGKILMTDFTDVWGKHRAALEPEKVTGATSDKRHLNSFFIHDSKKGFTHGCTETENEFFDILLQYRKDNPKEADLKVKIEYSNPQQSTNGTSKK